MANAQDLRAWADQARRRKRQDERAKSKIPRWNEPLFDVEKGPSLSGMRIEPEPARAPEPFKFKPLPSLSMSPPKELKYDSPFKQNFSVGSSDLGIQPLSPKTLAVGSNEGMSLANLPSSESMFSGYKGELSLPSLTGMAEKMGVGGSSAPEFDPAALGGLGAAAGIGAGLIGSAISAKKAADSDALSQTAGQWHRQRTDPALAEIERRAFAPVAAARRGAGMEGRKAIAANMAGVGSSWLGEQAQKSMAGSFGRAATFAQERASEEKRRLREENEEERLRRIAQAKAQPAQAGKFASDLVGLIPGPAGKIGQLGVGLGSKLLSSAIT